MQFLYDIPPSKELTDALIPKAGDEKSPQRYLALCMLEKSAADPRVKELFARASVQPENFPIINWPWPGGRDWPEKRTGPWKFSNRR